MDPGGAAWPPGIFYPWDYILGAERRSEGRLANFSSSTRCIHRRAAKNAEFPQSFITTSATLGVLCGSAVNDGDGGGLIRPPHGLTPAVLTRVEVGRFAPHGLTPAVLRRPSGRLSSISMLLRRTTFGLVISLRELPEQLGPA